MSVTLLTIMALLLVIILFIGWTIHLLDEIENKNAEIRRLRK